MTQIALLLPDGCTHEISSGRHSELIKSIVEVFCKRYFPNGIVLHVTGLGPDQKEKAIEYLDSKLGILLDEKTEMPDILVHDPSRKWIILIEASTDIGGIDEKRHKELKVSFKHPEIGLIFITAFQDREAFSKCISNIDWETNVWIAESPEHMIHFNGSRLSDLN